MWHPVSSAAPRSGAMVAVAGGGRAVALLLALLAGIQAASPAAVAAAADPATAPALPLAVKMRLGELLAAATPARAACFDQSQLRGLVMGADDYAGEIALYAGERLRAGIDDAEALCTCLGQLARAVARAAPAAAAESGRRLADLAPGCDVQAGKGIDAPIGPTGQPPRAAAAAAGIAQSPADGGRCGGAAGCATPLLRPSSRAVGPTSVHGDG